MMFSTSHNYLVTPFEFHTFLLTLFNARNKVEVNDAILRGADLPMRLRLLNSCTKRHVDDGRDFYVVFVGSAYGVTDKVSAASHAAEFTSHGYRLKARSLVHAHAMWCFWLGLIYNTHHLADSEMTVTQIIQHAKTFLPSKKGLNQLPPIDFDLDRFHEPANTDDVANVGYDLGYEGDDDSSNSEVSLDFAGDSVTDVDDAAGPRDAAHGVATDDEEDPRPYASEASLIPMNPAPSLASLSSAGSAQALTADHLNDADIATLEERFKDLKVGAQVRNRKQQLSGELRTALEHAGSLLSEWISVHQPVDDGDEPVDAWKIVDSNDLGKDI